MRDAFAKTLKDVGQEDSRVVLLMGDIGNRLFDPFKEFNGDRFCNCGIAEANMTGMAAGLALCGMRPFTYSITPFSTIRCLEQIRVDVCYQNLPVTITGLGAGLAYAGLGGTHYTLEDIALLRSLPNMTVICPADAVEVRLAVRALLEHDGPAYLRLGKKREPIIHNVDPKFKIGESIVVREGSDVCFLSTGSILPITLEAADLLEINGISSRVVSFHTVKPLDKYMLEEVFERFEVVSTVEEHSFIGGFGSAVAEWLCDRPRSNCSFMRFATPDSFLVGGANQSNARQQVGLTAEKLASRITQVINR